MGCYICRHRFLFFSFCHHFICPSRKIVLSVGRHSTYTLRKRITLYYLLIHSPIGSYMIQVAAGDVSACLSQYHLAIITQDTATYQAIAPLKLYFLQISRKHVPRRFYRFWYENSLIIGGGKLSGFEKCQVSGHCGSPPPSLTMRHLW